MISEFVEYVKQVWKNKPNVSSPLNADRLNHMEAGIENNSKKIKETVTVVNENTEKTDAALAIAGKPDEYSTSKTYAVGDKCIYENALYKCTTAISAAEAWTPGHWTKTSLCAEDAANKAAIKELTENQQVIKETFVQSQTDSNGNLYLGIRSSEIWILDAWSVDGCVSVGLTSESEYVLHCSTWTNWNRGVLDITVWYTYVKR